MTATNQKERNLSLQCKIGTRQLHDWELEEVQAFLGRLLAHPLFVETDDAMIWLPTKDSAFFVKSFYSLVDRSGTVPHGIVWNS